MKVIIVGAGDVGAYLAETLSRRNHDITVLEKSPVVADSLDERADVKVLRESGTSARALARAKVAGCDAFLALTREDETNLVAASLARALGAKSTFARVHDETFRETGAFNYQEHFGIDFLLNPERLAAVEIAKLIRNRDRVAVEDFARGQVEVQLVRVDPGSAVAGQSLVRLGLPSRMRVAAVQRGPTALVASADLVLQPGDLATLCGPPGVLLEVRRRFTTPGSDEGDRTVVIMGGGEVGVSLVRLLGSRRFKVRIIEKDARRCEAIAERFRHVTVIHGEGTSLRVLEEEQVGGADCFVACTRDDEDNVMACLQARNLGVARAFLAINRADYHEIVHTLKGRLGLDAVVSPRIATAEEVLRHLGRERFVELAALPGNAGRWIEMRVGAGAGATGRRLRDVAWPPGFVALVVQRSGEARTPGPEDTLEAGDRLVALVRPEALVAVLDLVTGGE